MNIPKLIFVPDPRLSQFLAKPKEVIPIAEEAELRTALFALAAQLEESLQPLWPETVQSLHQYTGLTFSENVIEAHVVQYISEMLSNPIILQIGWDLQRCKQVLLHASIHRLFNRNLEYTFNWQKYFVEDGHYPGSKPNAHMHVFAHALIQKVILEVWHDQDLMDRVLQPAAAAGGTTVSDVVRTKGTGAIMDEFHELLKNPAYAQPLGK